MVQKNIAGQSVTLFAYNSTTGAPVLADAANMSAFVGLDTSPGTLTPMNAPNITEWSSAKFSPGAYLIHPSQAETNADNIIYAIKSTTANTVCHLEVYTFPAHFPILAIDVSGSVVAGVVFDKTGYSLSTAGIAAIWDEILEGTRSARKFMRLILSVLVGKVSGMDANHPLFRDPDDTKNRVDALTDANGNRTSVTLDDS